MSDTRYPTDRESLERDCTVEYVRGSGPGGQHRNKRFTGIRLVHEPTGTIVVATERRSLSQNQETAFLRMAARLDDLQHVHKPRRPTRPSRGAIERRITQKKQRAQQKAQRKIPPPD